MITADQHDRHHRRITETFDAWLDAGGKLGDGFHVRTARTERRTFGLVINGHLATGHGITADPAKPATFADLLERHDEAHR